VRPSPGAAMSGLPPLPTKPDTAAALTVAAPEDGRTPSPTHCATPARAGLDREPLARRPMGAARPVRGRSRVIAQHGAAFRRNCHGIVKCSGTTATITPAALKKLQGISGLVRAHTLTYVRPFQILQNNELGSKKFRQELLAAAAERVGAGHDSADRRESGKEKAGRIVREEPRRREWKEAGLPGWRKGDKVKVALARRWRQEATMSRKWIARRLHTGSWTCVSKLLLEQRKH